MRHLWLSQHLANLYLSINRRSGYVKANLKLLEVSEQMKLGETGMYADSNDQAIVDYADFKAAKFEKNIHELRRTLSAKHTFEMVKREVISLGLIFPLSISKNDSQEKQKQKKIAAIARICCSRWWRRVMRKWAARRIEQVCRLLGMVNRKKGLYVSDYSLKRRCEQKSRNSQLLMNLEAENQDGYKATLAEMSEASVSNPVNRRNELMVRLRGYEEVAKAIGLEGLFITVTAPSRFHCVLDNGHRNSKYDGSTPRDAADYLAGLWACVRSDWARNDVRVFGFRIAEPHHDGTPHWHLLLFVEPEVKSVAKAIFKEHAVQENIEELDTQEKIAARFDCKEIDWERGSAVGYIAKYISKNIDGYRVGEDHEAQASIDCEQVDSLKTALRVEAWASTWGIRQFQQIGSVSVTVWRELRKGVRNGSLEGIEDDQLNAIKAAANEGDWGLFVDLMGGAFVRRADQPIRALNVLADKENRYGENFKHLRGIILRGVSGVITRIHEWKISRVKGSGGSLGESRQGAHWRISGVPPGQLSSENRCALDLCQ